MPRASSNFTGTVAVGKLILSRWRTCSMLKRGIMGSSSSFDLGDILPIQRIPRFHAQCRMELE